MRILILYTIEESEVRDTIKRHLYSFSYLNDDIKCHYLNIIDRIPSFLHHFKYDVVILHYTFLAGPRFFENSARWERRIKDLDKLHGVKIAIPQDEYDHTSRLIELFNTINISIICTCFTRDVDIQTVYKNNIINEVKILKVFTGYVDQKLLELVENQTPDFSDRKIDIGYRARKLPAFLGRHGQLKYELVKVFKTFLKGKKVSYDIESTNKLLSNEDASLVKLGNQWFEFILNCKSFIGCEGGSSLLDYDGSIKRCTSEYIEKNPDADFDELESACFSGLDYNIECFALSPRHFEAATCKSLQLLVEGEYSGIFKPWIHYVPIAKDFSNLDEVVTVLKDEKKCKIIIDQAYKDIVSSGLYTYEKFAISVINEVRNIKKNLNLGENILYRILLRIYEYVTYTRYYINNLFYNVKIKIWKDFISERNKDRIRKIFKKENSY